MGSLDGVRALVTGSTSGLGLAMASALASAGAAVVVTGRSGERAAAVAEGLDGSRAFGLGMDVRDPASVASGVESAWSRLGGVDLLVNNAGIGMRAGKPRLLQGPPPVLGVPGGGVRGGFGAEGAGGFLGGAAPGPGL